MKIVVYVLVSVTYDYYRFQDNLFASTDKQKCYDYAKEKYPKHLLLDYKKDDETEVSNLKKEEINHLWIQEL